MKVAVLGCGPAGLMAAHAVMETDPTVDLSIFSKKKKSTIGGAQYLHIPVEGITTAAPGGYIYFDKQGLPENYAMRVYGDKDAATSWGDYGGGYQPIWDMRTAYDRLWELYQFYIGDMVVGAQTLGTFVDKVDMVISTIPLRSLCFRNHVFTGQDVWITMGAGCNGMTIVYNGMPLEGYPRWYRESDIMGHRSREWSYDPQLHETLHVKKPLHTDCDCWPNIMKVGRFGRWQKGQLISDAYKDVKHALLSVQ